MESNRCSTPDRSLLNMMISSAVTPGVWIRLQYVIASSDMNRSSVITSSPNSTTVKMSGVWCMSDGGISGNSTPVRVGRSIIGSVPATIDEIMLLLGES